MKKRIQYSLAILLVGMGYVLRIFTEGSNGVVSSAMQETSSPHMVEKRRVEAVVFSETIEVIGYLGVPVGKSVTITGCKVQKGRGGRNFRVDSIDGRESDAQIDVKGIDNWPDGTEFTLKGREVGMLVFATIEMTSYGRDDPRWTGPYQELVLRFEFESILPRKNLDNSEN